MLLGRSFQLGPGIEKHSGTFRGVPCGGIDFDGKGARIEAHFSSAFRGGRHCQLEQAPFQTFRLQRGKHQFGKRLGLKFFGNSRVGHSPGQHHLEDTQERVHEVVGQEGRRRLSVGSHLGPMDFSRAEVEGRLRLVLGEAHGHRQSSAL